MQPINEDVRAFLIAEAFRFIERIVGVPGVRRIAMLGSLLSSKADPKDVDLLITVDDEADLSALAKSARRLKGIAQSKNKGADVFLANSAGQYIGPFIVVTEGSVPLVMPKAAVCESIYMMISMILNLIHL